MRKLFYAIIISFAFYFGFTHKEELGLVLQVFRQGDWRWLLAAVAVQVVWLVNIAAAFQATYRLVGVQEYLHRMIPLTAAANFVNVVAPSYGIGALAVLIADGRQRAKSAAKVTTAAVLYLVYDYLGFIVVLAIGLTIFYRRGLLDTVLIAASIFTVCIAIGLIIITIFGIQSSSRIGRMVPSIIHFINRILRPFIHRELMQQARFEEFAQDITEGLQHVARSPALMLVPGVLALTRKVCMMTILFFVSKAFGHPFPLDTLIAGFTTSYLFIIASITPSGVGFVEGAMTIYLNALQVPLAISAVVSIAYRGITFWLMLVYGLLAIRWIGHSPKQIREQRALENGRPRDIPHNSIPPSSERQLTPKPTTQAAPSTRNEERKTKASP